MTQPADDETPETQTDDDEETQEMLQKLCRQLFGPSNDPGPADTLRRRRRPDEELRMYVQEMFRPER